MKKTFLVPYLLIQTLFLFGQNLSHLNQSEDKENINGPNSSESVSTASYVANKRIISFNVYNTKTDSIAQEDVGSHFLGRDIAKRMYYFEEDYTYKVAVAPGNPAMKTMYRKTTIYESVKTIERYLKKSIRKGEMDNEQAKTIFSKVLDVALSIVTINTDELEQRIKESKSPNDLISLYTRYIHLNYLN